MTKRNRALWQPSNTLFYGYPCIVLIDRNVDGTESREYALSGPKGEIWDAGGGTLKAIVTHDFRGVRSPNEQLVRFGAKDLSKWIKRLDIPSNPRDQTPHANCFSGPLKA